MKTCSFCIMHGRRRRCSARREGAPRSLSSRAEAGRVRVGRPQPPPLVRPTHGSRCTRSRRGLGPRAGGSSRAPSAPCGGRPGPVSVLLEWHQEGCVARPAVKRLCPPSRDRRGRSERGRHSPPLGRLQDGPRRGPPEQAAPHPGPQGSAPVTATRSDGPRGPMSLRRGGTLGQRRPQPRTVTGTVVATQVAACRRPGRSGRSVNMPRAGGSRGTSFLRLGAEV